MTVNPSQPWTGSRWMMHLGDFANMLKAFIGSNYLGVAYAFKQSGLLLGVVCLLIIASLTDHCCHLIVKTKYHAMKILLSQFKVKKQLSERYQTENHVSSDSSDIPNVDIEVDELAILKHHMMKHMSYGDIGRLCFGKKGLLLVNLFIGTTQFCFCVAYFIFIGNTIHKLFPIAVECRNVTANNTITYPVSFPTTTLASMPHLSDSRDIAAGLSDLNTTTMPLSTGIHFTIPDNNLSTPNLTTSTLPSNITMAPTLSPQNMSTTPTENSTKPWTQSCMDKSTAPDLKMLVMTPLPLFLVFALIRSIRNLSWISVTANISILGGCVAVFLYMIFNFSVSKFAYANFDGVPVFFGMVTAAFEGIGLVIPVESSMEGNRHNFNCFLHGAVGVLTLILGTFGIMGYIMFGDDVQQMINLNIPSTEWVSFAVNIGVCVGVLLTFPLQIYPVIELIEIILFSEGSICGPKQKKDRLLQEDDSEESLLPNVTEDLPVTVAVHIPDSVSAWKRNIVRILVVGAAVGLAIIFRASFAYIGGFTGAVGSSALAFILPCLFHLKLCHKDLSYGVIIKDILIIVFGCGASCISLVYVIKALVSHTSV
ncbi:neutral amino acid uniporter 4-like [Ylistrum balloti]|uniref:neutral amino acid uniporter 4-like n=1 Tax=Ylistrum balloti TaxID=509963 RepID=UPI002905914F|nr:neutral amino acid uniporter 4-like [Ylistrum balloti]